ncbi:Elicitor-responsive protein 3 [Quillaja saponaria]|uniref:Elicitor-responsive protein 3 n=1 Tax=Quillaja saponaria TaxID=32244 RepID=A0AAD7PTN1_QUISA|nr:Elicitor-responsive protein 3 [Quillaja saponaria]
MSITGIHGHQLEVTVSSCSRLKDTEIFSRQDPYVCLEYASQRFRTKTCTDGGKNPKFQERFLISLIEGLRELDVLVFNSNTFSLDDHIGSGKVQLHKVLSEGYDDCLWPLQTKTGRHAGEVRLILHYANAKKNASSSAPSAPPYAGPPFTQSSLYSVPPPASAAHYSAPLPAAHYPAPAAHYSTPVPAAHYSAPAPAPSYHPPATVYPPPSSYPLYSSGYAPVPYPPPPQPAAYPPYPPTTAYPPSPYPPPPVSSHYPPPGSYPGTYPPPPHY